jgi:hypothetical protein
MLQTRDVECSRGEGGGTLMFGCCTPHGVQHARNMAPEYFFNVVNV